MLPENQQKKVFFIFFPVFLVEIHVCTLNQKSKDFFPFFSVELFCADQFGKAIWNPFIWLAC